MAGEPFLQKLAIQHKEKLELQKQLELQMEYSRGTKDGLQSVGRKAMEKSSNRWTSHNDNEAKMWREFADDLFEWAKQEERRYDSLLEKLKATSVPTDEDGNPDHTREFRET